MLVHVNTVCFKFESQGRRLKFKVTGGKRARQLLVLKSRLQLETPPPHHNRFTAVFRDHPGEPVPEENFWTLWCKGILTQADTPTIRLGATPSGLTSAYLHRPPIFFTGRMPFLSPNQQRQSTEGNIGNIEAKIF